MCDGLSIGTLLNSGMLEATSRPTNIDVYPSEATISALPFASATTRLAVGTSEV